jgi:TRAP-type transport system periplasmic protein
MKVVARLSFWAILLSFLGAFVGGGHDPCFAAQGRNALLIGNAAYEGEPLPNAVNDVRALGSALRAFGFEVVVVEDAGSETLRRAVAGFGKHLEAGGLGLFYYSGRGLRLDGADHLVPVDADTASEASVRRQAIGVADVIDEMSKPRPDRMNVLILDTCRDAPYGEGRRGSAIDDGRRRLPPDFLVVQATEPGSIAFDTGSGHGLYTEELLDALAATGDLHSTETFDRVAAAVGARTGNTQVPQTTASLTTAFELAAHADRLGSPRASLDGGGDVLLTTHRGIRSSGQSPDVVLWESIKDSRNAADYEAYLQTFPNGQFAAVARARADKYRRPVSPKAPAPQQRAAAPQIEESDAWLTVRSDANVREGPATTAKRIDTVAAGTRLHVTGKVKGTDWYRVEVKPGASGFLYGELASELTARPEGAEPTSSQPAAPRAAGTTTWELLTPFASDSFETRNLEQFASEIDGATNGAFKIIVLPTPSMRGSDIKQTVAAGRAPAGEFLIAEAGGGETAFEVDLVPFLATTYDEALALWDASRPVLQPMLEAAGLHLAFVVAHPPRGLFIDKEVWKMSDLRGVRILDDHPTTAKLATLAGAVPAERPAGTLAQAFAADRIDAMIASIPAGIAENAWTFVSDYYDLRVALPKSVVVFNRGAYAALDPEIQRAVLNASVAAQNRGWSTSAAANNDGIDLLRAKGMTVAAPPREVVDRLKQIGASMTRDWAQRAGNAGQAILGQYQRAESHAEQ